MDKLFSSLCLWCASWYLCGMSKQLKVTSLAGTKHPKPSATMVHMAKLVRKMPLKSIAALLLFGSITYLFSASLTGGALSLSALYLFANDGKISGRQSGSVKTRNGVERMFVVPRLVQNAYTSIQRTLLSTYSSAWASLLQAERDSWLNVDNVFSSNRFGVQIPIKGKALFIQRNANLANLGITPLTSYVASEGVASSWLTDGTVATTAGLITTANIVFTPSPTDATVDHLVYATATLPAGVSRPKGSAYRLIGVMVGGSATPFNVLTMYTAKYGNIATVGQKIGFAITPINVNTGQAGVKSVFVVEVS